MILRAIHLNPHQPKHSWQRPICATVAAAFLCTAGSTATFAQNQDDADDRNQTERERLTRTQASTEKTTDDYWSFWGADPQYREEIQRDNWADGYRSKADPGEYTIRVRTDARGDVFYWQDGQWRRADSTTADIELEDADLQEHAIVDDRGEDAFHRDFGYLPAGDQPTVASTAITGTIDGFRHVDLGPGLGAHQHTLIRLRLDDGESTIVALGPRDDLEQHNLQSGKPLTVHGTYGSVQGRRALIADKVAIDGVMVDLNDAYAQAHIYDFETRSASGALARMSEQRRTADHNFRGTVQDVQQIDIFDDGDRYTLLKLKTDDGRTIVANLGPQNDLRDVELSEGDAIVVLGRNDLINGRPVVVASRIETGGETVAIVQPRMQTEPSGRLTSTTEPMMSRRAGEIIANWPQTAKQAANAMIEKYGEPDESTPSMLIWHDNGPWKHTIVYKDEVDHSFPMPHKDVLEQFVNLDVPADKFDELAEYDGSVMVERTKGVISARCDKEEMNFLALNLANDIVKGDKSVEEARDFYAKTVKEFKAGQKPEYTQKLHFNPPREAGDKGQQVMDPADGDQQRGTTVSMKTIEITAIDGKFQPAELTVQPGQRVRLTLVNKGEHQHNIEIHLAGEEERSFSTDLAPGAERTLEFTAPMQPGTYEFYCPVADHKEKGMTGKLIVKASTGAGGSGDR